MSRKDFLRNRPRVLFCSKDEEKIKSNVQMTNHPPTSLTGSLCPTSSKVAKHPNCSALSETSTVTLDNFKRVLSNNTQDTGKKLRLKTKQKECINQDEICRQAIKACVTSPVPQSARHVTPPVTPLSRDRSLEEISDISLVTQHPTPSKWGSLMPDFTSSQTDDVTCDVMWDCSSPDAVRHLRKMRRNNNNHVKEIVKHVKDNQSVKAPSTPALLSVVLESRSLHIQKQGHQQQRHLTRQERLERRRVNKAQQVCHNAQALLEKILSAVEKQKCSEEKLQPAPQSDDTSSEQGDTVLPSVMGSTDDEGNKTEEDTWGDDSLFEEDSFIIQATQNPELFIEAINHSASCVVEENQVPGVTEDAQPIIQMVELCCSRSDSGNASMIAPTMNDAKSEHLRVLGSICKEEGSVGTGGAGEGETASLEVSPTKISVAYGASSKNLLESPKSRSAFGANGLLKLGQNFEHLGKSVDPGASVPCVAQLFGQSNWAAGEIEQRENRKGVAPVQEAGASGRSSQENKLEMRGGLSETLECDADNFNEGEAGTKDMLCGMDVGEATSRHAAGREPAQQCRRHEMTMPSLSKDGSCCPQAAGKTDAGASIDRNGELMDSSLPEEMLLQIIEADDVLDSQLIQEYPTQLTRHQPHQMTLVRPAAAAIFGDGDGFDDLDNDCLESISQFESFQEVPQRARQVDIRKECVVQVSDDHRRDDSATHSRGPHGPSDCKHSELRMKQAGGDVPLVSFVRYGSKKTALPFKRSVAFERSRDEFEKSTSCKQITKPIRNCMKITNDEENHGATLKKTGDFLLRRSSAGLRNGPLATLAQGNAVLNLETKIGRTGASKCARTLPIGGTSLVGKRPGAAADLMMKVPALHPEACLKEEAWKCNEDTMEFADEALFESQILALLDTVESQVSQQSVVLASQESTSQDHSELSALSNRKCSQEEIEKKRLAALMRRKSSRARVAGNTC